jgi:hypothetical protein
MSRRADRRIRACAALAAGCAALPSAGAADAGKPEWGLEGEWHLRQGAVYATHGLVFVYGEQRVIADAARYDEHGDDLYAAGRVVYTRPGVRIHADWVGLHPQSRTGEARDADVMVDSRGRSLRAHAEQVLIERDRIVLRHVHADLGYGGLLSFDVPTIRIYLLDEQRHERHGPGEYISGVDMISPTVHVIGVPVLWLPYLYRDYVLDYPWSKVEFGSTNRLGDFVRYWVGSNLPVFDGWHTRLEARGDLNSRAGPGFGFNGFWRHEEYGDGLFEYFEMPKEKVYGGPTDLEHLGDRRSTLFDFEHQTDLGHGAFDARWVEEPAPDPLAPGATPLPSGGDERFRSDYFRSDLDHRPLARKGAALAYGFPIGTVVVDTWRNPRPEWTQTERWLGLHGESTPLEVVGPMHARVSLWEEDLHRTQVDTSANRFNGDVALGGTQWLDGLGLDATGGGHSLRYDNGRLNGVEQHGSSERHLAYGDTGLRLRFVAAEDGWMHVFTPRIGAEATSKGYGDELPAYGFGDARDHLEEDQHYWSAGFDTALTTWPNQIRARLKTRWAMREQDRLYTDPVTGVVSRGSTRFADIATDVDGDIGRWFTLTGALTYDARPNRLTELNASAILRLTPQFSVHHLVYLITDVPGSSNSVGNEPGFTFRTGRYRFDGSVTMQPGGRPFDIYYAQLSRQMVDGELTFSYEYHTDSTGGLYEQRFGVGFTLAGTQPQTDSGGYGHGASYTLH